MLLVLSFINIEGATVHTIAVTIVVVCIHAVLLRRSHLLISRLSLLSCPVWIRLCFSDDEAHLVAVWDVVDDADHVLICRVAVEENELELLVHHVALFVAD